MSEVQRYITGIMTPVEMANPGPASISARQAVVVLHEDYAALEAECEQLKERLSNRAAEHIEDFADLLQVTQERDALRAELEAIKGQEPVGVVAIRKTEHGQVVEGVLYGTFVIDAEPGTKLYAKPTA